MNYIRKLPEREKNPETCCASVKEGKVYKNPVSEISYYTCKYIYIYNI